MFYINLEHVIENKVIGGIPLLSKSWQLSMDVLFTSYPSDVRGVLHLTKGCNDEEVGCRLPAILIDGDDDELELVVVTNINDNNYEEKFDIPINVYHHITVTHLPASENADQYQLKIYLNDVLKVKKRDDKPRTYQSIFINTGSPFYQPAQGYIKNFWHMTNVTS